MLIIREDNESIIPASPPAYRRTMSREENGDVFSRLVVGQQDPSPGGHIKEFNGKIKATAPLHCTHTVEGHNSSVLSIKVVGNKLFTASAGLFLNFEFLAKILKLFF